MRSLGALLFDAFIGRSVADDEDYDPDVVVHVSDDAGDVDVRGLPALCGYIFVGDGIGAGRLAEHCPDCVDILGYIPEHGPPGDEDDFDDDEDDDDDDEDEDEEDDDDG